MKIRSAIIALLLLSNSAFTKTGVESDGTQTMLYGTLDAVDNAITNVGSMSVGDIMVTNTLTIGGESRTNWPPSGWQNPVDAINWTWSSDGVAVTLLTYSGPPDMVIPEMLDGLPVTKIDYWLVSASTTVTNVTSITGGKNLTTIFDSAFYMCDKIVSVNLPAVTDIGSASFYSCTALTNLNLPSIINIKGQVFQNCKSLRTINLYKLKSWGGYALGTCTNLLSVSFSGDAPEEDGTVFYGSPVTAIYVRDASASGWGATYDTVPTPIPVIRSIINTESIFFGINTTTTPPAVRGGIYFCPTNDTFYKCSNGTDWVSW